MAVYIEDTLEGNINKGWGHWAVLILTFDLVMWIGFSVVHILYVPGFLAHCAALPPPPCECTIPLVDRTYVSRNPLIRAEQERAEKEREYLCKIQCPVSDVCPLDKGEGQSDEEYLAACEALKN